jgi:hypothetical protein
MKVRTLVAIAASALVFGGCTSSAANNPNFVTKEEFQAYKDRIKADGDALDAWVAATHKWILWLNANSSTFCPGCGVPPLPPDPPPDGDWQ